MAALLFLSTARFCAVAAAEAGDFSPAVVKRGKDATAMVDLGKRGSGTGFLIHASGIFVTNRHVVENAPPAKPVTLVLNAGEPTQRRVQARVILLSEDEDLALLKTDEPLKIEPLRLADGAALAELTRIAVLGYPFGKMLATGGDQAPAISINAGRVSALRKDGGVLERIQLDAATNPGNSGGPVMTADGGVVGVVVSGIGGANVNFAIPAARVKKLIAQPVLSMQVPEMPYSKRTEVREFDVEVFPTAPVAEGSEVWVHFGELGTRRSFAAVKKDGKYRIKAAPLDSSRPLRLRLNAQIGILRYRANVNDGPVKFGGRQLMLSEIRSIETDKKVVKTTLVNYDSERDQFETLDGKPAGLPVLHGEMNNVTVNLDEAESLNISAYDPGTLSVPYEIELRTKGRAAATVRGQIPLTNPPAGLRQDQGGRNLPRGFAMMFNRMRMMGGSTQELDLLSICDLQKDAKSGSWERKGTGLVTKEDPDAWCESAVVPGSSYELQMSITPSRNAEGELLIHLPIGRTHAILRINGTAKGFAKLELANRGSDGVGEVIIPPFEKDKECDISVSVATHGESARVFARAGDGPPLMWVGKLKDLAVPKIPTLSADRVAVGHQGLAMWLRSLEISAPEGSLRVLREWAPSCIPESSNLIGFWEMNYPWTGRRISGGGEDDHYVDLLGSPEFAPGQGIGGLGAMKLGGTSAGMLLRECPHTNKGWHPARAISMWFRVDTTSDKAARYYIFDEGGADKGYAIYLLGNTLYAGGWDHPNKPKWEGTWHKADGIVAGKWHHVALTLQAKEKDKSKALKLYLDGNEVGAGFGNSIGDHERIAFGTLYKSSRTSPAEPTGVTVENKQFPGLIDKVQIFNEARSPGTVKLLSGGNFDGK